MYRLIAVAVLVATVAIVVDVVRLWTEVLDGVPSSVTVSAWAVTLGLTVLVAVLCWFLASRAVRAWREPTEKHVRDLYMIFAGVVVFVTYGLVGGALERTGGIRSDFVELVAPWAAAIIVGALVYAALRRWAIPRHSSAG